MQCAVAEPRSSIADEPTRPVLLDARGKSRLVSAQIEEQAAVWFLDHDRIGAAKMVLQPAVVLEPPPRGLAEQQELAAAGTDGLELADRCFVGRRKIILVGEASREVDSA